MRHIYAPNRSKYLTATHTECVFCEISLDPKNDKKNFVFYRDEHIFGVMNLYPYAPGHMLFVPHDHTSDVQDLAQKTYENLFSCAKNAMKLLYDFGAEGINLGMNLRAAAGAGIPEHAHLHLVPRYENDVNFMAAIANTRVYGFDFEEIFLRVKNLVPKYF